MNFNQTIPFLFYQISTNFRTEMERQLSESGLHAGQIFILFELWTNDGLSQVELAAKLNLSPPTINKMVKSLARNHFVICGQNPTDGRGTQINLTPKGSAIRLEVEEKWQKLEDKLIANLTATEQLVLSQLFGKIVDNLTAK